MCFFVSWLYRQSLHLLYSSIWLDILVCIASQYSSVIISSSPSYGQGQHISFGQGQHIFFWPRSTYIFWSRSTYYHPFMYLLNARIRNIPIPAKTSSMHLNISPTVISNIANIINAQNSYFPLSIIPPLKYRI